MNDATGVFQPLQADDPPLVAGYRLAARLGAGGMGRVYLSHTQGGRPLAIKVVRPELAEDPSFRRRFRREIAAARRVRGAYTAELIDADPDGTPPWLATLYVPGPSLAEVVARNGPLPVPAALWLMAGVAEALQGIHDAGIVHRDLKPSNVLLAADGPRVIDFGVSLASDATSRTTTGATAGTPSFMAPEQASPGEVTAAADIFALGQTVAFAALGRSLYGDGPAVYVLYQIVHSAPDLSELPARLRPLIARCLAAEPEDRATAAEIVEWCRRELGEDAGGGAGPEVWQEVTGPGVTVPPPVPATPAVPGPTPFPGPYAPYPSPGHGHPGVPFPTPGFPFPARYSSVPPGPRPPRKGRIVLIATALGLAGSLLVMGATWTAKSAIDRLRHESRAASSTSGGDEPASGAPLRSSARPKQPLPLPYPNQMLIEKNSLYLKDGSEHSDRKGDIRLSCDKNACELESETGTIELSSADPGASLGWCRALLTGSHNHHLSMSDTAYGSEVCVKDRAGDIALFVIQTKMTANPEYGSCFVTGDLTVWRAP
ncbi:serine/threonine-protein kinase [Streptomyces sp. NPDC090108]|uniref:serine/threonine-protein kinase n=1 Tax=Streptomyces sp. NPDC090108 TaxID=3365947 RepID=UPI00381F7675